MIAMKLVRLIESHPDELAKRLLAKLEHSARMHDICRVPRAELELRAYEVYRDLAEWLLYKTEQEIEKTYTALGRRRTEQGVPFGSFFWAIVTTREVLWEFLQDEGFGETPLDLHGGFELLRLLERFYDKALYYATIGYHQEVQGTAKRLAKAATA